MSVCRAQIGKFAAFIIMDSVVLGREVPEEAGDVLHSDGRRTELQLASHCAVEGDVRLVNARNFLISSCAKSSNFTYLLGRDHRASVRALSYTSACRT